MSKDSDVEHIVKKHGLLDILNESLLKGANETRRDALWILGNLASSKACSDLIIRAENDLFDRIVDEYIE